MEKPLLRLWDKLPGWAKQYGPLITGTAAAVMLAIGDTSWSNGPGFIRFIVGFGLFLVQAYLLTTRDETLKMQTARIRDLEKALAIRHQRYGETFRNALMAIADSRKIAFTERLSVYKPTVTGTDFVLLGRYSSNQSYDRPGRGRYPIDEGLLGRARREGGLREEGLPDPKKSEKTYLKKQEALGLERRHAENLNMKARSYYLFLVSDSGSENSALAVIESTLERLSPSKMLKSGDLERISSLIRTLKDNEPTLDPELEGD